MAGRSWPAALRPVVMSTYHAVSAGHYLASAAAFRILEAGGNAVDAGVAAGLAMNVVQSDLTNLGGVAPILIRLADGTTETIAGLGPWPRALDPEVFRREHGGRIPRGVRRCVVPAAAGAWLLALERHGTMPLGEVATPAIELAEDGFPMHHVMRETIGAPSALEAVRGWPATAAVFLDRDGQPLALGELVRQPELGRTLRRLCEAEHGAPSRAAGLRAARDRFYRGDVAETMVAFVQAEGGWLTRDDLAEFEPEVGQPVGTDYRGRRVLACGPWCQGPVVPEALNILEGYELAELEPFGARHYHLVLEALKAAFADRDRYYGDPRFVDVPIEALLSKSYAAAWRERIDPERACPRMPDPGDAWAHLGRTRPATDRWRHPDEVAGPVGPDTSYVAVVDRWGNAFSATPSDGAEGVPLVPGLGVMVSSRGMQSWLDPDHPSAVAPGKRPRLTPSPGLVLGGDGLVMPFGTPGLDMQPQAMVQFLVNLIDFGMDPQQAMEAPRAGSYSFPLTSDPHPYAPGLAQVEARVDPSVPEQLARMGHRIEPWPAYTRAAGSLGAVMLDGRGVRHAAADPRRIGYAIGR